MRRNWWKILCCILLIYAIIAGFSVEVPELPVVEQTIRNIFFHVGMWFTMIVLLLVSLIYSIKFLKNNELNNDIAANELVNVGIVFGIIGIVTGMIWAKFTWGVFWTNDPKLNGAAVGLISYLAYKVLRSSVEDEFKKARIAAVYNIFAFVLYIVFILILPKTANYSIHPGNDGSPAMVPAELDSNMRYVFYPAMIGWILLGVWIASIRIRISKLKKAIAEMPLKK
jgi:heme exporter protein C